MFIIIKNKFNKIVYQYPIISDTVNNLEKLKKIIDSGKFVNGEKFESNLMIYQQSNDLNYYFLHTKTKNKRDATYQSKVFISAINTFLPYRIEQENLYNLISDAAYHNSKNINHGINNGISKLFNTPKLFYATDKVEAVHKVIVNDTWSVAKELLTTIKSIEQIYFEYTIIDYLRPGILLSKADLTNFKLHSLIVQAFYIYEADFITKQIKVKISENHKSVRGNFFTLRSALALIFQNCIKYCKSNSEISISFINSNDFLKMSIKMESIYTTDEELAEMFLPNTRGQNAIKCAEGSGLGLYICRKLFELNEIEIDFTRLNDKIYNNGICYCSNMFLIEIPIHKIIG